MDKSHELQDVIYELLNCADEIEIENSISEVYTYSDAGMLTTDAGLLITLTNGDEYQVTIVRRR